MSKHVARHQKARMIRAAAEQGPILAEAVAVEWIRAQDAEGESKLKRFSMVAYTGGAMQVGFGAPVVIDLSGLTASAPLPILLQHDVAQIVGHADDVEVGERSVTLSGVISGGGGSALEVIASARNGFPWKASVGVAPAPGGMEWVGEDATTQVNGKSFKGPLYVARKAVLGEVSFVALAADGRTSARVAAAAAQIKEPAMEPKFIEWLKANGFDPAAVTEQQQIPLRAAWQASQKPAEPAPAAPAATVKAAAGLDRVDQEIAEFRRRQAIEDMTVAAVRQYGGEPIMAGRLRDLAARAIEGGMSVKDFDLELMRFARPMAPTVQTPRREEGPHVLQAAAYLASGQRGESIVKELGEPAVEAAERRFAHNMGLQEIILAAANANGYTGRQKIHTGNWKEVLTWAIPDVRMRASGWSSVDLTNILGNVANKSMAAVAAEPQWLVPALCGTADHTNFHAHTVCSLAVNGELQEVTASGGLEHLDLGEETYTRQVGTRGAILRLSRKDIVNDDLGAFTRMGQALARKSYTTREKVFFTLLMASGAGVSHFTAARGNYLTSASSAFGATGVGYAIKGFRGLEDAAGDPIMVEPSIILLPPTLEGAGRMLLAPNAPLVPISIDVDGTVGLAGAANPYAGRFGSAPLTSAFLENSSITGNSTAYWYMFADPRIYPCYEIAYLNGATAPTVEYFGLDSDIDTLGVSWRVYWDFGVAAAEWRAGVKCAGS